MFEKFPRATYEVIFEPAYNVIRVDDCSVRIYCPGTEPAVVELGLFLSLAMV